MPWHFYFFNDQLRNFPTFCSRNDRARGDVAPSRKPLSTVRLIIQFRTSARHIPGHRAAGADRWSNELTKIFPSLHEPQTQINGDEILWSAYERDVQLNRFHSPLLR